MSPADTAKPAKAASKAASKSAPKKVAKAKSAVPKVKKTEPKAKKAVAKTRKAVAPQFKAGQSLDIDDHQITVGKSFSDNAKMTMRNIDVYYGDKQAIHNVSIDIAKNEVMAMIGPSGCGKSTFLRTLNRMNDTVEGCRVEGDICMDGENLYAPKLDVVELRARVGMVFQNVSNLTPSPNQFMKMWPMVPRFMVWPTAELIWMRLLKTVCAKPASGKR